MKESAHTPDRAKALQAFDRLLNIMDELREKCPWDQKQTWESLRRLTLEEVYELSEAVIGGHAQEVKEELGDMLLHIVFYVRIASEKKAFTMAETIDALCEKLVERHPHVYGNKSLNSEKAVKQNWERVKLDKGNASVLQGVPKSLPALIKAIRIQEKAAAIGFDWESVAAMWKKVEEEIGELKRELHPPVTRHNVQNELGDVLFSLVNYARLMAINPEDALERANQKFIRRFQYIENASMQKGIKIEDMTPADMNACWERSKLTE